MSRQLGWSGNRRESRGGRDPQRLGLHVDDSTSATIPRTSVRLDTLGMDRCQQASFSSALKAACSICASAVTGCHTYSGTRDCMSCGPIHRFLATRINDNGRHSDTGVDGRCVATWSGSAMCIRFRMRSRNTNTVNIRAIAERHCRIECRSKNARSTSVTRHVRTGSR